MTEVVAALLWEGDRFLICQRPAHKTRGLLWEFVGGKVEPGIEIGVEDVFMEVLHTYPDMQVHLTLFNSRIQRGAPQLLEHHALRWILPAEIPQYDFCPADQEILAKLRRERG